MRSFINDQEEWIDENENTLIDFEQAVFPLAMSKWGGFSSVFLRFALGLSFLSAVADRFGLWGNLDNQM